MSAITVNQSTETLPKAKPAKTILSKIGTMMKNGSKAIKALIIRGRPSKREIMLMQRVEQLEKKENELAARVAHLEHENQRMQNEHKSLREEYETTQQYYRADFDYLNGCGVAKADMIADNVIRSEDNEASIKDIYGRMRMTLEHYDKVLRMMGDRVETLEAQQASSSQPPLFATRPPGL